MLVTWTLSLIILLGTSTFAQPFNTSSVVELEARGRKAWPRAWFYSTRDCTDSTWSAPFDIKDGRNGKCSALEQRRALWIKHDPSHDDSVVKACIYLYRKDSCPQEKDGQDPMDVDAVFLGEISKSEDWCITFTSDTINHVSYEVWTNSECDPAYNVIAAKSKKKMN